MSSFYFWIKISRLKQYLLSAIKGWITSLLSNEKLRYWIKVSRLTICVSGALAAWLVALLSNGPTWLTLPKVSVFVAMFFNIWGASVWHYGRCHEIYAKKHWDPVKTKNPQLLMCVGAGGFIISILISWLFLPVWCTLIVILNAITIMFLYAGVLDQYWPWKNITIALVCLTPWLFGWFSGHRLCPVVPSMIFATFFFYVAREMFKDMVDWKANMGRRMTMVMEIGIDAAAKVGGIMLLLSIFLLLYSLWYLPDSLLVRAPCILGMFYLSWFAIPSLRGRNIAPKFRWMDIEVCMVLICLLLIRIQLY